MTSTNLGVNSLCLIESLLARHQVETGAIGGVVISVDVLVNTGDLLLLDDCQRGVEGIEIGNLDVLCVEI